MGRVALDQVSKRFDDVAAVDALTLDVAALRAVARAPRCA